MDWKWFLWCSDLRCLPRAVCRSASVIRRCSSVCPLSVVELSSLLKGWIGCVTTAAWSYGTWPWIMRSVKVLTDPGTARPDMGSFFAPMLKSVMTCFLCHVLSSCSGNMFRHWLQMFLSSLTITLICPNVSSVCMRGLRLHLSHNMLFSVLTIF